MDYKNSKIYQILNHVTSDVYIGSTTQPLCKVITWHRATSTQENRKDRPLYKLMHEIGVNQFYIELLHACPCENKEQLKKNDGECARLHGTLNNELNYKWTNISNFIT